MVSASRFVYRGIKIGQNRPSPCKDNRKRNVPRTFRLLAFKSPILMETMSCGGFAPDPRLPPRILSRRLRGRKLHWSFLPLAFKSPKFMETKNTTSFEVVLFVSMSRGGFAPDPRLPPRILSRRLRRRKLHWSFLPLAFKSPKFMETKNTTSFEVVFFVSMSRGGFEPPTPRLKV